MLSFAKFSAFPLAMIILSANACSDRRDKADNQAPIHSAESAAVSASEASQDQAGSNPTDDADASQGSSEQSQVEDTSSAANGNHENAPAFVNVKGRDIVDGSGKKLFLKGINLGNWLVWEGYIMVGDYEYRTHSQILQSLTQAFQSAEKAAQFEYEWRLHYVDEKAIADLKALGFNAVRAPFNYKLFWQNQALSDEGFEFFDNLVTICRKYGLYVLPVMHGAPGYQNPGDHSDNVDSNASHPRDSVRFWDGDNAAIAAKVWQHFASRYKGEPTILGYDLINEPVPQPGREYELLPSLVTLRNAIRSVDTQHLIVAEGNWWGSDLSKLDWTDKTVRSSTGISQPWDNKLVYEIHHYGPLADTVGREALTNRLNIPLILGEFGETDDQNLRDISLWSQKTLAGSFPWTFKKISHDKALWTIPMNDGYRRVTDYIREGGTPPSDAYDVMLKFARENIRNGQPDVTWQQSFYDSVK